ncbi:MAG: hypothetical protein R3195_04440 [Gemmatimonadota bacterium]|nr:hypothetical protein [Gemmatimonadota bacterium]
MDMDLIVIFTFVTMVVLIITAGVVLLPISRKLGTYLEEAAIERREARLAGLGPQVHGSAHDDGRRALAAAPPELMDTLARLESQLAGVAERQAFVERLLEERQDERGGEEKSRARPVT